ncbi:wall-associated receptor kinase 2-like [Quercus robur]|uniref:wall-associated receptor kinase 2-like n=1 Tax=Quercus robur TaxID=38942 RepID=UPI0021634F12|nr:wall-associated receptor kinase 2-like [Quercus robur]
MSIRSHVQQQNKGWIFAITKNKFVAVGCDTYAYLNGVLNGEPFSIGCLSKCTNNTHNIVDGTCSGIGCCQIDIPTGLRNINFAAYSFYSHKEVWSFNPCSFAFIIQRGEFNFSAAYLTSLQNNRTLPMVLDWAIGNDTCEVALNKGNYICGANSNCSNRTNGPGYRCKCKEGYEGYHSSKRVAKDPRTGQELGTGLRVGHGEACVADQPAPKSSLAINLSIDDRIVAIKKSKMVDQSQIEQFIEVVVLSQINHRNVVKLLGCCLETSVPLLVYEFVANGTLFEYIHNESKVSTLSWEICLRIATETAEALSYLHSAASTPIIHRDVKSSNILLDSSYIAKVSDFGASRLIPLDQIEVATMVQGTIGYLDPEYLHTSQLTEKSDVYSLVVVLVELLIGRKTLSFYKPEMERSLVTYFLLSLKENRLFEVLGKHIAKEGNAEQLKEVAILAKKRLKLKGEDRPTMKEVATKLEGLRKMEKHSWVNFDSNFDEIEHLLAETSNSSNYDVRNKSIGVHDSVKDHVILDFDNGR